MKSIQSKFLTIIISGMLILAVAISIVSLIYIGRILEVDSDVITDSVANTESQRIDATLQEVAYIARAMEKYVVSTLSDEQILRVPDALAAYLALAKDTYYAMVGNEACVSSFYLQFAPEVSNGTAGFLMGRALGASEFQELPLVDISDLERKDYNEICWYSEPIASGKAVWISPYRDPVSNDMVVSYTIPIYKNYRLLGVVGVDIDFSVLTDMVADISVYNNGFAYLESGDGETLYFSPVDDHLLKRAHTDHGFAEEHKTLENGMKLVIHADYSDIQRNGYRMLIDIIIIVLVLLLSFTLITYFLTKRITSPLQKLTVAAEMLADGGEDLDLASCKTGDEVGVLATAFEKTAKKLSEYMGYVNALAYKDSLTGVKNSTAYKEMTAEMDLLVKRGEAEPFAILVADVNGLKLTNDKYGHEFGNKLIIKVARIICDVFKHSPVFRIGGDEFAVVLKGVDFENREELLAELNRKSEGVSIGDGDQNIAVSFARAIADFNADIDDGAASVFRRADTKMYEHKNAIRESRSAE